MKKLVYIIPGLGESCREARYKKLIRAVEAKGYEARAINPDWRRPLSEALFPVEKDAIVFGFSMGAVLAYLVAKKYPCKKVIFGSMSPIHTFSLKMYSKFLGSYLPPLLAKEIAMDLKKIKVSLGQLKTPFIRLIGEREKEIKGDLLVPETGHYMSVAYINAISAII